MYVCNTEKILEQLHTTATLIKICWNILIKTRTQNLTPFHTLHYILYCEHVTPTNSYLMAAKHYNCSLEGKTVT